MLFKKIDLTPTHVPPVELKRENRDPEKYRDYDLRKRFPRGLRKNSLQLLKKLLFNTKKEMDATHSMSAAGPFSNIASSQCVAEKSDSTKLDPSSQVTQLYHKLLDKLIFSAKEGIEKTTFTLNSAAFRSSVFRGATVSIIEYSTAPKIFNIQFTADPKAAAFFEQHAAQLQNALNNGGHNFDVERIDISLTTEDEKYAVESILHDPEEDQDE